MQPVGLNNPSSSRLLSLDFMRGFIMVLLALESTGLYDHLFDASSEGSIFHGFMQQFFHHPWNGLRFWDLIQPGFMFMAGVSMAYSLSRQRQQGFTRSMSFKKTLKRCGWLFFWGVLDYAVRESGLSFELWDVLTQLSFTTLVTFLIFEWSATAQILFCVFVLLLTEMLYRFSNIPNFNQPFTDQHNFGNYVDVLLMHKINKGGWVAINCLPTSVHTIAGALTGRLFLGNSKNKLRPMLMWALICLAVGYSLDMAHITPIIKRIATSSFTLASLGWCLLGLVCCYWWIDVLDHKRHLRFFIIVGTNSLFIYLFFEIVGHRWFNDYVIAISGGLMKIIKVPALPASIISSLCIFALEWGLCYFLYKKKIFFKL
ncbi:acyltransferase family protein [Parafilimonas sp.]|uniref:acyltransferase family protein n=1 Tax=Parafilimonas sp. TaxID=1969739 RepID=UPI0039E53714